MIPPIPLQSNPPTMHILPLHVFQLLEMKEKESKSDRKRGERDVGKTAGDKKKKRN